MDTIPFFSWAYWEYPVTNIIHTIFWLVIGLWCWARVMEYIGRQHGMKLEERARKIGEGNLAVAVYSVGILFAVFYFLATVIK